MPINVLVGQNGTFEAATPPPQENGDQYHQWRDDVVAAHGGAWSGLLYQTGANESRKAGGWLWNDTALDVGRRYTLTLWATPAEAVYGGPGNSNLLVRLNVGGSFQESIVESNVDGDAWEQISLGPFEATSKDYTIEIGLQSKAIGSTAYGIWLIDDVQLLAGDMAKTALISTAILSDLSDISVSNGFSTDVAQITREPTADIKYPGLSLRPLGSGNADLETLTNTMGQAVQLYEVVCHVRSSTPYAAIQNLLDDVRNSVERSSSAVHALGDADLAIRDVVVSEWTGVETSTDIDMYKEQMSVTIEVSYTYNRGSL